MTRRSSSWTTIYRPVIMDQVTRNHFICLNSEPEWYFTSEKLMDYSKNGAFSFTCEDPPVQTSMWAFLKSIQGGITFTCETTLCIDIHPENTHVLGRISQVAGSMSFKQTIDRM